MSYENQDFTEHTAKHTKPNKNCEYCQADRENKAWKNWQKLLKSNRQGGSYVHVAAKTL